GYVKTARARNKIRQWFRKQNREQNIATGRAILERELKRLGFGHLAHEEIAGYFGYKDLGDFLAAIGAGDITTQQVCARILESQRPAQPEPEEFPATALARETVSPDVHVLGTGGLLTRIARCCHPLPGEPIVGYVTQGHGITIHRRDCPNVLNLRHPERLIEVAWGKEQRTFPVRVFVTAFDRTGLLRDISDLLARENVNIATMSVDRRQNLALLSLTLEVTDIRQLSRVLARIARVPNVIEAQRQTA
ncbi:MAG: bifunctional (p)ppGpp synthetase/guanosine-3',5'-bis(diphosphate) 3'-pyrophosphohydrolase, partial [Thermoflexia bacterium]